MCKFVRLDVLVNNAGDFHAGFLEELADARMRAQFETLLFGPMNVTRRRSQPGKARTASKAVTRRNSLVRRHPERRYTAAHAIDVPDS